MLCSYIICAHKKAHQITNMAAGQSLREGWGGGGGGGVSGDGAWGSHLLVLFCERFVLDGDFVDSLRDADDFPFHVLDWHCEHAAGFVTGHVIYLVVKAWVLQGVENERKK